MLKNAEALLSKIGVGPEPLEDGPTCRRYLLARASMTAEAGAIEL